MNAEALIAEVRKLLVYDLDVPQTTPGSTITDAEILDMLNIAQDDLARECQLYSPSIAFTLAAGSTYAYDNTGFAKRLAGVSAVYLSDGQKLEPIKPSQLNPVAGASLKSWYFDGDALTILPAQTATFTGYVQGNWLPKVLALGAPTVNCELPNEIQRFHLPRYTLAMNALIFATESQQIQRIMTAKQQALDACADYRRRSVARRSDYTRNQGTYRV